MNFLEVTIRGETGELRAENSFLRLAVPASRIASLAPWRGKTLIQPERLHFFDPATELAIR